MQEIREKSLEEYKVKSDGIKDPDKHKFAIPTSKSGNFELDLTKRKPNPVSYGFQSKE